MEILLWILLVINSVFGDKLGRGYLPPPGALLSGGDLSNSDLPFELPNNSPESELKSSPRVKPTEYSFTDFVENYTKTYDKNYDSLTTKALYDSTTTSPITDYSSTLFPQTNTVTDFVNGLKGTKSEIPHFVSNQFSGYDIPKNILDSNSTRSEGTRNGINNEYLSSATSMPIRETNVISKGFLNMDSVFPNIVFNKEGEIFNKQRKYTTNYNYLNEPSLSSRRKSQIQNNDNSAITTKEKNSLTPDEFAYSFDTSNGLHSDVSGTGKDGVKSKGTFSYTGDDGKLYMMEYRADENGFHPKGAHLPTPPPIPKEIQNVIEQAYKDKVAGIFDDGSYSEEKYGHKKYMPHFKNEVIIDNKGHIIQKTRGMIKPTIVFRENEEVSNRSTNMPVIEKNIPVQIIYDQGYDYVQPQNKILNVLQSSMTKLPNRIDTSEEAKIGKNFMEETGNKNAYRNNLANNKANVNIAENSNIFKPSSYIKSLPKINESEIYYKTTKSLLPSTYDMNYINFDEKPNETFSQAEITTNFMTTARRPLYLDDLNKEVLYMPEKDAVTFSTINPDSVTTDIPRTETIPIYVQEQVQGEDFSGPKQMPTYNPNSGYYY